MIHITEKDKTALIAILQRFVPKASIYVFGSRATGIRLKPFSDLDLAIDNHQPLQLHEELDIKEALDESNIPYRVDIIDLKTIDPGFLKIIEKDITLLLG